MGDKIGDFKRCFFMNISPKEASKNYYIIKYIEAEIKCKIDGFYSENDKK